MLLGALVKALPDGRSGTVEVSCSSGARLRDIAPTRTPYVCDATERLVSR